MLDGEQCDNGFNNDAYKFSPTSCGTDCMLPPYCGDGIKQGTYELCDNGNANSDAAYNGCTTKCDNGPYCGDGHTDVIDPVKGTKEACDNGPKNVAYAAAKGACSYDCQAAPYCGDGVRNGPEQCDLGTTKNTGDYGTCKKDCTFAPRCGDGIKQANEQCDDGPTGSQKCTVTCRKRDVVQ
jgi:cysteine-rich repeat protein